MISPRELLKQIAIRNHKSAQVDDEYVRLSDALVAIKEYTILKKRDDAMRARGLIKSRITKKS